MKIKDKIDDIVMREFRCAFCEQELFRIEIAPASTKDIVDDPEPVVELEFQGRRYKAHAKCLTAWQVSEVLAEATKK